MNHFAIVLISTEIGAKRLIANVLKVALDLRRGSSAARFGLGGHDRSLLGDDLLKKQKTLRALFGCAAECPPFVALGHASYFGAVLEAALSSAC
jgi:hypothetical protein